MHVYTIPLVVNVVQWCSFSSTSVHFCVWKFIQHHPHMYGTIHITVVGLCLPQHFGIYSSYVLLLMGPLNSLATQCPAH